MTTNVGIRRNAARRCRATRPVMPRARPRPAAMPAKSAGFARSCVLTLPATPRAFSAAFDFISATRGRSALSFDFHEADSTRSELLGFNGSIASLLQGKEVRWGCHVGGDRGQGTGDRSCSRGCTDATVRPLLVQLRGNRLSPVPYP